MTRPSLALATYALLLAFSACRPPGPGREALTEQIVKSSVEPVDEHPYQPGRPQHPVAVYADRSGSMRGFLDPAYPNRNDYRSVIDGLQARLSPQRVYGFGSSVRQQPGAGLDVLGNRAFYDDANTQMEQVIDSIAVDSSREWNHLIVGDGRRSDPNLAYRQFVRMRELALRWTEGGGTFLVAVSRAPFTPVQGDPSGCHAGPAGASGSSPRTCPLYAFVFAAPGDGMRIAGVLSDRFEHVWAYPMATLPLGRLTLRQDGGADGVTFDPSWVPEGASAAVPKIEGETPATTPLRLRLEPADSSPAALVATLLRGQRSSGTLFSRTVTADDPPPAWRRHDGKVGPVRVTPDGRALTVFSPGGDDCKAAKASDPCGMLYRLDLRPAGTPVWLAEFEAAEAADLERTFGLGRLFEPFIPQAASAPPLARVYLLVR